MKDIFARCSKRDFLFSTTNFGCVADMCCCCSIFHGELFCFTRGKAFVLRVFVEAVREKGHGSLRFTSLARRAVEVDRKDFLAIVRSLKFA